MITMVTLYFIVKKKLLEEQAKVTSSEMEVSVSSVGTRGSLGYLQAQPAVPKRGSSNPGMGGHPLYQSPLVAPGEVPHIAFQATPLGLIDQVMVRSQDPNIWAPT